jgi:hypothetical protein
LKNHGEEAVKRKDYHGASMFYTEVSGDVRNVVLVMILLRSLQDAYAWNFTVHLSLSLYRNRHLLKKCLELEFLFQIICPLMESRVVVSLFQAVTEIS